VATSITRQFIETVEHRLARGDSCQAIAAALGVNPSTVRRIRNGKHPLQRDPSKSDGTLQCQCGVVIEVWQLPDRRLPCPACRANPNRRPSLHAASS